MIYFSQIPDKLKYPPNVRAKLSTLHSSVITYAAENYNGSYKFRKQVVDVMNALSFKLISGDSLPVNWSPDSPLQGLSFVDEETCRSTIKGLFLTEKEIHWDIEPNHTSSVASSDTQSATVQEVYQPQTLQKSVTLSQCSDPSIAKTPKEDLYLKPPTVPLFDTTQPFCRKQVGADTLVIYKTLPEIPTKQNEISVTTEIDKMSTNNFMKLYPNQFIRTRAAALYERVPGLDYDENLGVIIPVEGFTRDQLIDNIVKYPHLYKLSREVNGQIVSFYTTIEIDGALVRTLDIWDSLPESEIIPKNSDFIKEYVVRRYLLERDIKGIKHNYPMYGSLDPFLTLFTTSDDYIRLGYVDTLEIAKRCVASRVSYKRTRNPILRRLSDA